MHSVLLAGAFVKEFRKLQKDLQDRIREALKKLEENPFDSRPGADIKLLVNTDPKKHRLRVGDYRIIYYVEGDIVRVIDVFHRGKGY
jgi:mRNA-degrading endonuclease RelE of RelBE toxin-antitoxin system